MQPTFFFYLADAVQYASTQFGKTLDLNGLDGFEYIPQQVFQFGLDPVEFEAMRMNLVWFTQNDVILAGASVPNLYIVNPRTPETSSLVRILSGNDTHVNYAHVYDDAQTPYTTTNRQFILNAIKV